MKNQDDIYIGTKVYINKTGKNVISTNIQSHINEYISKHFNVF